MRRRAAAATPPAVDESADSAAEELAWAAHDEQLTPVECWFKALGSVMERSLPKGKYDRLKPIHNLFCSEVLQKPHRGLVKALGIVFVLFG